MYYSFLYRCHFSHVVWYTHCAKSNLVIKLESMRWPDQTSALCSVGCGRCRRWSSAVKLLRRVRGGCVSEEDTEGCRRFWRRAVAPQSASCNNSWKLGRSGEENPQRLLLCTNYKRVESLSCRSAQLCCRDETTILLQTGNVHCESKKTPMRTIVHNFVKFLPIFTIFW